MRPGFSRAKPSLAIYEFDPSWQLHQKQIHHIDGLNYGHDFVLLPDYYVFHMTPFVKGSWWTTTKILMGWTSPGEEMRYYPDLPSRFVIIPRHMSDGNAGVMLVDTEPCHVSLFFFYSFSAIANEKCFLAQIADFLVSDLQLSEKTVPKIFSTGLHFVFR